MRTGMARHMCSTFLASARSKRERRLAEREAAVVGGNRARNRGFNPRARKPAQSPSVSTRFIRQPPPSAMRVRPARAPPRRSSRRARRSARRETLRPPRVGSAVRDRERAAKGERSSSPSSMRQRLRARAAFRPAPPAPSPPDPRIAGRRQTPESAATASNSRPRLVVIGARAPRDNAAARRAASGDFAETAARPRRRAEPGEHRDAHPPRLARRPVAAGKGERRRDGRRGANSRRRARSIRRPRARRRRRSPARRARRRARAPRQPCSAAVAATWATWCCTATHRQVRIASAERVETKSGCRSQATTSGSTSRMREEMRIVSSRNRIVARSSRSPRYCETKASRPRVIVTVFLRSAAIASTQGPSAPRSIGSGTKPRARRRNAGAPSSRA